MAELVACNAGAVTLSALEAGRGGRPLLLVHGFTGAKEDFGDFLDRFAAHGWWVVAPDLRGHGASPQPADEAQYSLDIYAQDLLALTRHLGWDQFALVGHSMGGMVAQEIAVRTPECLDRLVLMDTHHGPVEGLDHETVALAVEVLRTKGVAELLAIIATLPQAPLAPSDARLRAERPGYQEFAESKAPVCSAAMYAAMAGELVNRRDRLEDLAGLDLPVLVLVGEEDRGFLGASQRMAESIPGARLVVVPDAAHSPQFENAEAWWDATAGFLLEPLVVD